MIAVTRHGTNASLLEHIVSPMVISHYSLHSCTNLIDFDSHGSDTYTYLAPSALCQAIEKLPLDLTLQGGLRRHSRRENPATCNYITILIHDMYSRPLVRKMSTFDTLPNRLPYLPARYISNICNESILNDPNKMRNKGKTHLEHPGLLSSRKGCIANIIRIIHIIMNVVQPCYIWTTVLTTWTSACRDFLNRSVRHRVSRTRASLALKDVEEAKPVAYFVCS